MTPFRARWTNNVGDTFHGYVFGFVVCKVFDRDNQPYDEIYAIVQHYKDGPLTNVEFTEIHPVVEW